MPKLSDILWTVAMLCIVVAFPVCSLAHDHPQEHAQLHQDFYRKLQRPDAPADAASWQKSCCSDRDCAPARARFQNGSWEFLKRGEWAKVPQSKIVEDRTPDMQAHACISVVTDELLCFVKPDFGI